jgi:hypothetical protein
LYKKELDESLFSVKLIAAIFFDKLMFDFSDLYTDIQSLNSSSLHTKETVPVLSNHENKK